MQTVEAIKKYIEVYGADGHSILDPTQMVEFGFEQEFVNRFSYDHASGKSYKETLFDTNGNPLQSCLGVYTLDFLYGIAKDIEADTQFAERKMGRGFQASELITAIKEAIQ